MAQEIELKLTIDAPTLRALRAHPALSRVTTGKGRTATLTSTYYDTPQYDLAAAGVALRLRRDGRRWWQTAKGGGSSAAGLHARVEHEWPLKGPGLDRGKLQATPWHRLFAAARGLKPVFATEFKRTSQPLELIDGTRANLCIDVGIIRAGRRRISLTEVEFELSSGEAGGLFDLALTLAADLPLRVSQLSKAELGYALATGRAPEPRRAQPVPLDPSATTAAALAAVATDCLAQIGGNAHALCAGADEEHLHQLRVGMRRLRSLLKLTAGIIAPARLDDVKTELRWLARAVGPARDWDVLATQTLPAIAPRLRTASAWIALRRRIARRRRDAHTLARAKIASPRFHRLLLLLGASFATLSADASAAAPARHYAQQELTRQQKKLDKRAKHLREAKPSDRHALRIAAKKLRYTAEFFAPLFPNTRASDYIGALAKLQGVLGTLNDYATAERLVAEVVSESTGSISGPARRVHRWLAADTEHQLARLDRAWRAFAECERFWN